MQRVWKPLDVNGLRLYQVEQTFDLHKHFNKTFIVAARSPRHAKWIIENIYKDTIWTCGYSPDVTVYPLNVLQPKDWTE